MPSPTHIEPEPQNSSLSQAEGGWIAGSADWCKTEDHEKENVLCTLKIEKIKAFIAEIVATTRTQVNESWYNQPANEHDNRIREHFKEEILAGVVTDVCTDINKHHSLF